MEAGVTNGRLHLCNLTLLYVFWLRSVKPETRLTGEGNSKNTQQLGKTLKTFCNIVATYFDFYWIRFILINTELTSL